jgi:hypothetical protein
LGISVEGDKKNSERERINMTNKLICPEDGMKCILTEEQKDGKGCWNCPKIQGLLEKMKEVDEGGEKQTQ